MHQQGGELILEEAEAEFSGLPATITLEQAAQVYARVAAQAIACTEFADELVGDRSCRADSQRLLEARERARVLSGLACQLAQLSGVAPSNQEAAIVEQFLRSIAEL